MEPDWFQILISASPSNNFLRNGLEIVFKNEDQERNRIAKGRETFAQESKAPQSSFSNRDFSSTIWSKSMKSLWESVQPYFENSHSRAVIGGSHILNELSKQPEGICLSEILYLNAERLYQSIFSPYTVFPINVVLVAETCSFLAKALYSGASDPADILAKIVSDICAFAFNEQISQVRDNELLAVNTEFLFRSYELCTVECYYAYRIVFNAPHSRR